MKHSTRRLRPLIELLHLTPDYGTVEPILFPAEPWRDVLLAAIRENWRPRHQISEYCIKDEIGSAEQRLGGYEFADALNMAAHSVPESEDSCFWPDEYDGHLRWFFGHNKSHLDKLIKFARKAGCFHIRLATELDLRELNESERISGQIVT